MAQGQGRLSKGGGGGGGGRGIAGRKEKRVARAKKKAVAKGRKHAAARKSAVVNSASRRAEVETTKAINRRNESLIAAKAVSVGTKFFLGDIAEKGTKEVEKQVRDRNKKQEKSKATDRLKEQLRKLGGGEDAR